MQPGHNLLHYRLIAKIGEGGMGVVWKALDTTLDREVAIKVLPDVFADDTERLSRFEREARLLASLNHPSIATIHGFHRAPAPDSGKTMHFLAMEMVEGEDLSLRLKRGPLPVEEALAVLVHVAAALEAAHARGVVHRDLKPANVVLTAGGKAKVLDFGLAKAVDPDAASASGSRGGNLSLSPTVTSMGTVAGMILGTAAYMSPEQARGKPLDRRADLWSFGCVLYECLTGTQLFRGETVSDSLAAVLRKEPDWSLLPPHTPPLVRLLVRRCLTRDPEKRLQDAGEARLELEHAIEDPLGEALGLPASGTPAPEPGKQLALLPWAVAVAAILAAGFFALRGVSPPPEPQRRLMIPVPGPTEIGDLRASPPAISPDGRHVVYGVMDSGGEAQLWLRPLNDFTGRSLADTSGAQYAFWSPDSRHIGFFLGGKLRRLEVASGRVQTIGGEGSSYPRGGSWNARGQIIFAPNSNAGIHLIDAAGGTPRQITTLDPQVPDCSHRWPVFLPDGEHFLYLLWTNDILAQETHGGIYLASLSGEEQPRRLIADASNVAYAPPGHLFMVRGDNLVAVPFDVNERKVTGEAAVIASGVLRQRANGHSAFTVSAEQSLVYASGQSFLPASLNWYDRSGNATPGPLGPAAYGELRLSPDSSRALTTIPGPSGDEEIWVIDLVRGVRTRLVHGSWTSNYPVWSASGERLLFASQEKGTLDFLIRSADGSGHPEPVLSDDEDKILFDWSRDGNRIAYWPMGSGSGTSDVWIYSREQQKAEVFLAGDSTYSTARFSPDGRWLAYVSDDSGRAEVFVQAIEGVSSIQAGARWQLSITGGDRPRWRDDGREIVYMDPERRIMAVSIQAASGALSLGSPQALFTVDEMVVEFDASGDHQRFLFATRDPVESTPLHVILNWNAGL